MTIANVLTLSRIGFIPFICWAITLSTPRATVWAAVLFALASLTDYFDGYIAHRTSTKTSLGSFLDPLADKLLIIMVFSTLSIVGRIDGFSLCAVGLIFFRELFMLLLRPKSQIPLLVIPLAKWKTAVQMLSAFLFLQEGALCTVVAVWTLWVATALSIFTALMYVKKAIQH